MYVPSINSARYAQRIQTESHESPSFLRKVHRLDPPESVPVAVPLQCQSATAYRVTRYITSFVEIYHDPCNA